MRKSDRTARREGKFHLPYAAIPTADAARVNLSNDPHTLMNGTILLTAFCIVAMIAWTIWVFRTHNRSL